MNPNILLNSIGASTLLAYIVATFFCLPVIILITSTQDNLDAFQYEILSGILIVVYIVCQGRFNGLYESITGTLACCSQLVVGYFMAPLLKVEWSSKLEYLSVIAALILPAIICLTIISVILGLIILAFWGSFTTLVDMVRADRFKNFKREGNLAHVIITGGGTGLGATTAIGFAKMGCGRITILSRNQQHLDTVIKKMKAVAKYPDSQVFYTVTGDVTNADALKEKLEQHIAAVGVPDLVIACAGLSTPGYFMETSGEVFQKQCALNYMGCVNTCKAVIPLMLNRKETPYLGRSFTKSNHPYKGQIVLVSSALGVMGSIGYSAYCPTKFAVRGLGECLRQEYAPQGLDVSCFYPSNMKTEGFAEEMKTKPIEARRIDEQAATIPPEVGTEQLLMGLARGQFHTSTEWLIDAMRVLSNGISPSGTPVIELLIHPALHVIGRIYRIYMDWICEEEAAKRSHQSKSE